MISTKLSNLKILAAHDESPSSAGIGSMYLIAWAVSILAILFSLVATDLAVAISPWIFFMAFFVLGMPHGIIDALLLFVGVKTKKITGSESRVVGTSFYLGLSLLYLGVWYLAPTLALASFLLLTAFHWGSAEFGRVENKGILWYALGLSRGLTTISAMFAFRYEEAMTAVKSFSFYIPHSSTQCLLIVSLVVHLTCLYVNHVRYNDDLLRPTADYTFMILLLAFTPVLMGVGIYYMFFHSMRFFSWFDDVASILPSRKVLVALTHSVAGFIFIVVIVLLLVTQNASDLRFSAEQSLPGHLMALAVLTLPHAVFAFRLQKGGDTRIQPKSLTSQSTHNF